MPRAIWSGAISFGLVNVPVKMYSATSPKTVRFHQLSSKTGSRIKQKRVDPSTGDEVLSPDRLDELDGVDEAEATQRELKMAQQLIASLSSDFDPSKFKDEYRERVLDLIERKANGEEIAVQPQAEDEAPAPDLMAALEASLADVRSGDSDEPTSKKPAKKTASKQSSSAKTTSKRTKAKS